SSRSTSITAMASRRLCQGTCTEALIFLAQVEKRASVINGEGRAGPSRRPNLTRSPVALLGLTPQCRKHCGEITMTATGCNVLLLSASIGFYRLLSASISPNDLPSEGQRTKFRQAT